MASARVRRGGLLLWSLWLVLLALVHARPSPAAHCRILAHASTMGTQFSLLVTSEEDRVELYDDFEAVQPSLKDLAPEEVYATLRPAFQRIAAFMRSHLELVGDPRFCKMHLLVLEELRTLGTDKLDQLFHIILQASIEDAQYPFLLAREDLRLLPSHEQNYLRIIGANYLKRHIEASLDPGSPEIFGAIHLRGRMLQIAFDTQERWRRVKRHKRESKPLNGTDFFERDYQDFGRESVHALVLQEQVDQLKSDPDAASVRYHPCLARGYSEKVATDHADGPREWTLTGTGDAEECAALIQSVLDKGNEHCPKNKYCALQSQPQPKPGGPFYAIGDFVSIAKQADVLLGAVGKGPLLDLPTPSLASLRTAAESLCALQDNASMPAAAGRACLDLSYVIVLLHQFGLEENVHFIDRWTYPASANSTGPGVMPTPKSSAELVAWLTGAYLYLEVLQEQQKFTVEADLLAVQVREGIPLGWHLSVALLLSALGFLFYTSGSSSSSRGLKRRRHGSYQRVNSSSPSAASGSINSGGSTQERSPSTFAIRFIDDASE